MANSSLLGSYGDNIGSSMMFRNKLINGNFDIWQRSTDAVNPTNTSAGGYPSADRWKIAGHQSGVNWVSAALTRVSNDAPAGSRYSAKLRGTAAAVDDVAIVQLVEAANSFDLVNKTATLTVYLKKLNTLNGTLRIDVFTLDAADVAPTDIHTTSPVGGTTVASSSFTANDLPTSWTKYTLNIPTLGSAAANGLMVRVFLDGTDLGIQDLFGIAQVQLEAGPVATPFEQRPIGMELALCQRYFYNITGGSNFPGTGVNFGSLMFFSWSNPTEMRTSPTVSYTGLTGSGDVFTTSDNISYANYGSLSTWGNTKNMVALKCTLTSGAATPGVVVLQSNRIVSISAEL